MNKGFLAIAVLLLNMVSSGTKAQYLPLSEHSSVYSVFLRSESRYKGISPWRIKKVTDLKESGPAISRSGYSLKGWMPAVVPGTVLNTLVSNKVYPEPYFGDNNRKSRELIPDIADAGRDFYNYWFRTEPAVSGFEEINSLAKTTLDLNASVQGSKNKTLINVVINNPDRKVFKMPVTRLYQINSKLYKNGF